MRGISVLLASLALAACTLPPSSAEQALIAGSPERTLEAQHDADAILQGMEQARLAEESMARAARSAPLPVTR
jgi:hypothetical protein